MNRNLSSHPLVQDFLDRICAKVRASAVHDDIRREMLHHLEECVIEQMDAGMTEEEAIAVAVEQMGDPQVVGKQLNAAHRPKLAWDVLLLLVGMLIVGGVTLLSLYSAMDEGRISIIRKITFAAAGVSVMGVLYFINYRRLLQYSSHIYVGTLFIMAIPIWQDRAINGAKIYITFAHFTFNVYTAVTYLLIVAAAGLLYQEKTYVLVADNKLQLRQFWKEAMIYIIVPSCLFMAAPAMGSLLIYLISISVLLLMKGKWKLLFVGVCSMGVLLLTVLPIVLGRSFISLNFAIERHLAFFHRTEQNSFYYYRSIEAIHAGGWWGQGFGVPSERLPSIVSEMTFSYLVYSLGWVFGIAVALLVLLFLIRIARMGMQLRDGYARALIIGLTTVFAVQYVWTILMCIGLLPILAMQLPIVNWASGTVIELGALGLMLGAYRRKDMLGQIPQWPKNELVK
ncbi:cell division protein FtsW (lipid II flippase) [Paenibacillus cellulosilyticus]|uniref:Cell division protein FtsW (Lipid II flippase) n=1 Tax=Paenibacillus cellulosilyticus TaxID=375489 RepID=A0A2V2YYD4_9BACL|nr:FtsW/RodA/SpoVE family cell cycle protein [Paenibacillus cellulosilyticus]PWW07268.1 cell division protein FtsW (lipid II flippase) [Paenibacillus cellulosilyticus]QKS44542.1 FtsW/RodA/SpoVE family cell cycle protein [Paenibacillus cellulosilyticus]